MLRALAGVSKSDSEALRNLVQDGKLQSIDIDKAEPLLKAGLVRKHPWSELGNIAWSGNGNHEQSEGSGLQFCFPADSIVLSELLQEGCQSSNRASSNGASVTYPSSEVRSKETASGNGQQTRQRKSFFEV